MKLTKVTAPTITETGNVKKCVQNEQLFGNKLEVKRHDIQRLQP